MQSRPLKVVVKSPFSTFSGYGNDGFGLVRALHRWGCDVYPQPTWMDIPIPRDILPLFGKTMYGPFDLIINHWCPDQLEIRRESRAATRVAVAWTMWEFARPPEALEDGTPVLRPCRRHEKLNGKDKLGVVGCPDCKVPPPTGYYPHGEKKSTMRERLRWFDMLLGYDEVSLSAMEPFLPRNVKGSVLQGGYESAMWKPVERDWHGDRFQFLMHGQLNARKAPWTTIEAWHKLKAEKGDAFAGARLALHTSAPGNLFPELNAPFAHAGIKVFVSGLDIQGVKDMYAASHCLLAPSRGEGKNLPALEFMSTAGAVAATNFGGHTQWLGGDWAYPLGYDLTPTFPNCPWGAHDAKVSVDHLADTIWDIYTHRDEARQKGLKAAELIPKTCDWSVVVENLFRRIRDEVTSNNVGPQVYDVAMSCRREEEEAGPVMVTR
jgi:glycosyltransferase involved in cell wall biosynthesis